jgi:hypothetical protein
MSVKTIVINTKVLIPKKNNCACAFLIFFGCRRKNVNKLITKFNYIFIKRDFYTLLVFCCQYITSVQITNYDK